MCPLTILTDGCINESFFYKKMYGRFARGKKMAIRITRLLYYRDDKLWVASQGMG